MRIISRKIMWTTIWMNKPEIKDAVLKTLLMCGKPLSLPVPIKKIIREGFPNVRLVRFSKQMQRRGITYEEMKHLCGTEDACTDYYAYSDTYVIYYNDVDKSKMSSNRYRWNIAHELGHIALAHHKKYKESRIFRNEVSNELYSKIEEEANMFAAYILVPHIVISCVTDKKHIDIKKLCKVSGAASNRRYEEIQAWGRRNRAEPYDCELLGFFSHYVEENAYSKIAREWLNRHRSCQNCSAPIEHRLIPFCQICGAKHESHYKILEDIMTYSKIDLDDKERAIECPVCHNTEVAQEGNFCVICGNSLVNLCSETGEPYGSSCNNNEPLPGNARYCPYCGSESTFLKRGILPRWNNPNDKSLDDEELPF